MTDLTMTSWEEFEKALADVLRREVVDRVTLNLGVRDDVPGPKIGAGFLQRGAGADGSEPMLATIFGPGPDALSGLNEDAVRAIEAAGWVAESGDSSWGTEIAWPASSAQYATLARSVVVWLCEVGGVTSPEVLGYAGWRDPLVPYDQFAEDRDPGRSVLYLPTLGITRELPQFTGFPPADRLPASEFVSILDDFVSQPQPSSRAAFDEVALMRGWFPLPESSAMWALPIDYLRWVNVLWLGDDQDGQVVIGVSAPDSEGNVPPLETIAAMWDRTVDGFVAWMGEPVAYTREKLNAQWSYRGQSVLLARNQDGHLLVVVGGVPGPDES